ncbi:MAG: sporulation integral membrane protein YtvI [Oscillospiraceae bacterium]|nr:sporulation integral membrane protein YtvI [Oscillospiraceae bacterium]
MTLMDQKRSVRVIIFTLYAACLALALWFSVRFILPWTAPFLLAFLTSGFIEPAVRWLVKHFRANRTLMSVICSLVFLLSLTGIAAFLSVRAFSEASAFIRSLPDALRGIPEMAKSVETAVDNYIHSVPEDIRAVLYGALDSLSEWLLGLPAVLSDRLLSRLSSLLSAAPRILFFIVTYIMAVFFTGIYYGRIKAFILRQIPPRLRSAAGGIKADVVKTLEKWLMSYAAIMLITFLELTVAFLILRIEYAALLAAFIAVIDALPVLGTGTVLLPWAAWELICGNVGRAVALAVTYLIVTLVHGFIEPKIVGSRVGLSPVVTLLALYAGFKAAGVAGMVLAPLSVMIMKLLNDRGYIRLWRE